MKRCRFQLGLIIGLLAANVAPQLYAQCATVTQLSDKLSTISEQTDLRQQYAALQQWKGQWDRCGYAPDSTYVNGLLQLGQIRLDQNELPQATQWVRQAVQLTKMPRPALNADQPAKARYRLGMLLNLQNRYRDSFDPLNQAVRYGQRIPSAAKWVGNAYLFLASNHTSLGDYQLAIGSAERGESVASAIRDNFLFAKLLQEKAKALIQLARPESARWAAEQAIALVQADKKLQTLIRVVGYRQLGMIAESQHRLAESLTYERKAFETARDNQDPNAANYAVTLGMRYYRLGLYDQAAPYFGYSIDHNKNLYDKAQSIDNLGAVYWQKKQFMAALRQYQRGLLTMPIGFTDSTVQALPSVSIIRQTTRKQYLLTLIRDKADTWLDYAKATQNKAAYLRHALATYQVADQIIDHMRWEQAGQLSKLYWRKKTRTMYERAIETCALLDDAEQALRFFEKSRAVMLADKLNELGARQQLSKEQFQRETELRQAVNDAQSELANKTPNDADYRRAQEKLAMQQDDLDAFIKRLEVSNPTYFQNKYDTTTTKLSELKGYLRQRKATLVSYFVGDSAVYVLSVEPDRARLLRLFATVPTYKRDVRAFINLLSDPNAIRTNADHDRLLALGHSIYRQALAPLSPPAGCVIVSPDRFFVPFEALSASATKADYLVQTYAFDYAYSARLLLRGGRAVPTVGFWEDGFLGFAPVTFAPKLGQVSLPGSDESLTAIGERFRRPKLFTHQAATRQAFETHAPHARIIQLFTHAVADTTDREPLLYFADDTLRLSVLSNSEPFNAQLAILGACQTGVGTDQVGEGVFSLARGFASLGVPSIVSTLWSVQDQATYDLTESFYQHLDEGMTKDVALQQAKQDWLRTHEGMDLLPSAWAGLILIGDTEPLNRPVQWAWVVGGALALLGAGALWWRRRRNRTLVPNTVHLGRVDNYRSKIMADAK